MKILIDTEGREWKLDLKISTCNLVLAKCGFDLLEPNKYADLLQATLESPRKLLDFLWVIVQGQHELPGDTDDQRRDSFLDKISDISAAKVAVYEELEDFFLRSAPDFLKIFNQMKTAARKILDAQTKKVEELLESGQLEEHLEKGIDKSWNQALQKAIESQSIEPPAKRG